MWKIIFLKNKNNNFDIFSIEITLKNNYYYIFKRIHYKKSILGQVLKQPL